MGKLESTAITITVDAETTLSTCSPYLRLVRIVHTPQIGRYNTGKRLITSVHTFYLNPPRRIYQHGVRWPLWRFLLFILRFLFAFFVTIRLASANRCQPLRQCHPSKHPDSHSPNKAPSLMHGT